MEPRGADLDRVRRLTTLTLGGKIRWEPRPEQEGYTLGTESQSVVLDRDLSTNDIRLRVAENLRDEFSVTICQDLSIMESTAEEYELNSSLALLWQAAEKGAPRPKDSFDKLLDRFEGP